MHLQMLAGGALELRVRGDCPAARWALCVGSECCARKEWLALLVLLLPQWFALLLTAPYIRVFPWLHETRLGRGFSC